MIARISLSGTLASPASGAAAGFVPVVFDEVWAGICVEQRLVASRAMDKTIDREPGARFILILITFKVFSSERFDGRTYYRNRGNLAPEYFDSSFRNRLFQR